MHIRQFVMFAGLSCATSLSTGGLLGVESINDRLLAIDAVNYDFESIGMFSAGDINIGGLAADPRSGRIWGVSGDEYGIYMLDPKDAHLTFLKSLDRDSRKNGLAYDANRDVLWISASSGEMLSYNIGTGVVTSIGMTSIPVGGLAYDPVTDRLYGVSGVENQIYQIDTSSLDMSALGDPLFDGAWSGLTFDQSTRTLLASSARTVETALARIDPVSGQRLSFGYLPRVPVSGLAYVPTPGVASCFMLAGVHVLKRRRRG